jgi:hypothetical protein
MEALPNVPGVPEFNTKEFDAFGSTIARSPIHRFDFHDIDHLVPKPEDWVDGLAVGFVTKDAFMGRSLEVERIWLANEEQPSYTAQAKPTLIVICPPEVSTVRFTKSIDVHFVGGPHHDPVILDEEYFGRFHVSMISTDLDLSDTSAIFALGLKISAILGNTNALVMVINGFDRLFSAALSNTDRINVIGHQLRFMRAHWNRSTIFVGYGRTLIRGEEANNRMTVLEHLRWRNRSFLGEQIFVTDVTSVSATVIRDGFINESLVEWARRRLFIIRSLAHNLMSFHGFGVGPLPILAAPQDVTHRPVVPPGSYEAAPREDAFDYEPVRRYGMLESNQSFSAVDRDSDYARGASSIRRDVLYSGSTYDTRNMAPPRPANLFAPNYGGGFGGGFGLANAYQPANSTRSWDEGSSDNGHGRQRNRSRGRRGGRAPPRKY